MSFLRTSKITNTFRQLLKDFNELKLEDKYVMSGTVLALTTSTYLATQDKEVPTSIKILATAGCTLTGSAIGLFFHAMTDNVKNPSLFPKLLVGGAVTGYSLSKLSSYLKKNKKL